MGKGFEPNTGEIAAALPHVLWEIERLVQEFDKYVDVLRSNAPHASALECMLLHARNLYDFFVESAIGARSGAATLAFRWKKRAPS